MPEKFTKASGKTSPKITDALNLAVTIVSKVAEVAHWIGAVALIILAIFGFTGGAFPGFNGNIAEELRDFNIYGFEAALTNGDAINYPALGWFAIAGVLIMIVMAMVFRNIYLITKASRESTPFTQDNMRMVKELGIYFIIVPVIGIVFSGLIRLFTGVDEIATDCNTVLVGLIMLYLTQIFARGVALEDDVKDLV